MTSAAMTARVALALLASTVACGPQRSAVHSHGPGGHAHGESGHGHDESQDTTSYTLFTDSHELFVELDLSAAGETVSLHAQVTRLADNAPAAGGTFGIAFLDADDPARVLQSCAVHGVARPGTFTPRCRAPERAGRHRLVFRYQFPDGVEEWDAGVIEVGQEPVTPEGRRQGEITFPKEASWAVPFRVRRPEWAPLARTVTAGARVEADPRSIAAVAAPVSGRVLWSHGDRVTLSGTEVEEGAVLGRLVPDSAFSTWNALELELQRARIEAERAQAELRRVEGLVADGLLAERRLAEARAVRQRAGAALAAARRESSARAGEAPPVELRSPLAGLVLELSVAHGEWVQAGRPVAQITSPERVLVVAAVRGVVPEEIADLRRAVARPGDPSRAVDLVEAGAELLAASRLVDRRTSSLPVTWSVPNDGRLLIGEFVELVLGVGEPEERLTVPVEAVVEVNTRPYAFVQRTGESFERRALVLGATDGERVAVLEGLDPEDRVVTRGGFDVYVASLGGGVESHRH